MENDDKAKNTFGEDEDLEYECERCIKKISFKEYKLSDYMGK